MSDDRGRVRAASRTDATPTARWQGRPIRLDGSRPARVHLLVLPNSVRLDVVLGMEVLRFANGVTGRPLFEVSIVSSDLASIRLTDGGVILP